jgi:hypothetical protein
MCRGAFALHGSCSIVAAHGEGAPGEGRTNCTSQDVAARAARPLQHGSAKHQETTMQAFKRIAKVVLPVVIGLPCFAAYVFAGELRSPVQADTSIAPVVSAAQQVSAQNTQTTAASQPRAPTADATFGVAMSAEQLDAHRGGEAVFNDMNLRGTVANNTARNVDTGSNMISGGSFSNASGLPTVIQNTGANVLIQNATIVNVRFGE